MSITTYPLDGPLYSAQDIATYLCTRTSGVYSKETNYAVTITGARQLTVAPGLAWINYDDFAGVSVCSRAPVALTVPEADATLPRKDRVVLQFDTDANFTALKLKPGTPAADPQPPAIQQNHRTYELGLAVLTVPAGTAAITSADLTDTRADEAVCGLMRDGVTGIPTAQLQAQALAMMTQLSTELHTKLAALDAAIASVESGSFYTKTEADAKFGTPYSLPAATVKTLGGVKVGDYLDIAPDGTLSAKTLNDKIAAAVAVKSEPRLVWNHHTQSPTKWKTYDVSIPDGVDYLQIKTKCQSYSSEEITLVRGGTTSHLFNDNSGSRNDYCTMTFQADGTLHVKGPYSSMNYSYAIELWLSGYHYPTLADLLTETQASQADTDALAVDQEYRVAMLELGLTDDTTTDTSTT